MRKIPCVYMMADRENGIIYVGTTSTLAHRVGQHKDKTFPGFTARYGLDRLVWYEVHQTMDAAIRREKQIKRFNRSWKVRLISIMNPEWRDLFDEITG